MSNRLGVVRVEMILSEVSPVAGAHSEHGVSSIIFQAGEEMVPTYDAAGSLDIQPVYQKQIAVTAEPACSSRTGITLL